MNHDDGNFFSDLDSEVAEEPSHHDSADQSQQSQKKPHDFGRRAYPEEVFSTKIHAQQRTFFIDLKDGENGQFLKISERSRNGQRSTILMDAEDIPAFTEALDEVQKHLRDDS